MGFGTGGHGWAWLYGVLLVAGLVLLAVVVGRLVGGGPRRGGPSGDLGPRTDGMPRARRVLEERYARGEISTEEYQQRRRVLDEGQ